MAGPFLIIFWALILVLIVVAFLYARRANMIRERLEAEYQQQFDAIAPVPDENMYWLQRWLFVAGFRRAGAAPLFLGFVLIAIMVGITAAVFISRSPALHAFRLKIHEAPGKLGLIVDPMFGLIPWLVFLMIASLPWIYVRARRRKRVTEVEEDLPISLQVLATLARAGLGFDASLLRLLESADPERTLPQEFSTFRRENMAGIQREQCWRRLARRIDLSSISIFVSAMVHAEQVGGGISEVLEHQTEDVQNRRREQALIKAQALPAKLVFPLVICFLLGIFCWTLGPAIYDVFNVVDGMTR